ncbi:MAG: type IV pilus modification protein PilV [Oleibacter sp.]|nr:type IV pilus modification protein PilV [Thalassolituus sp.]
MTIRAQQGITIIEVMVTIAITTIGLLGLSAMQMQAVRSTQDSGQRSQAIWVANDLINRIRANSTGNYDVAGAPDCEVQPAKFCSAYNNGAESQPAAADCTVDEMATYDLWETMCGIPVGNNINAITTSSSLLTAPDLVVATQANGDVSLTVSWDSRTTSDTQFSINENSQGGANAADYRSSYTVVFRP